MGAFADAGDCLWWPLGDNTPAAVTAFGAKIDHPVGFRDDIEIVLDYNHRVAGRYEAVQDVNELFHVGHVQPNGGFIEYVERGAVRREC